MPGLGYFASMAGESGPNQVRRRIKKHPFLCVQLSVPAEKCGFLLRINHIDGGRPDFFGAGQQALCLKSTGMAFEAHLGTLDLRFPLPQVFRLNQKAKHSEFRQKNPDPVRSVFCLLFAAEGVAQHAAVCGQLPQKHSRQFLFRGFLPGVRCMAIPQHVLPQRKGRPIQRHVNFSLPLRFPCMIYSRFHTSSLPPGPFRPSGTSRPMRIRPPQILFSAGCKNSRMEEGAPCG